MAIITDDCGMVFGDYTVKLTHLRVGRAPGEVVKSDGDCVYPAPTCD